jgi:phage shock protein A
MTSIFAKVRVITLGNFHSLLDKVIDLNSIPMIEQYVRDLEDARKDLQGTLAEKKFDLTTAQNDLKTHQATSAGMERDIQLLASQEKNDAAKRLAVALVGINRAIEQDKAAIATVQGTVARFEDAVARVVAQEQKMKTQLGTLRTTVALSRSQQRATAAVEAAGTAIQAGGSIDNLAERIGHEAARSQAAFENALGAMETPADASTDAEADALLARLTQKSSAA